MWKKYNIQLEMPDFNNVLAVISLGDQLKNINRLIEAFKDIASQHHKESNICLLYTSLFNVYLN